MRAMVLERPGGRLRLVECQTPHPPPGRLLVRVAACGVCRTDLHVVDGDLKNPRLPVVPGHEIVGYVEAIGAGVEGFGLAQRVGVPWLGSTCGSCQYCKAGHENLCDHPGFTGYTIDGGFADYTIADARYCFSLDVDMPDAEAAPLMCAGLIGYRSLRFAGGAKSIGIYGFGAAALIITQVATWQG